MWSNLPALLFIFIGSTARCDSPPFPYGFQVKQVIAGNVYNCCQEEPYTSHRDVPVIYCFEKLSKGILRVWMDIFVETGLNTDDYDLYEGIDSEEVWNKFIAQRSSWTIGFNWQKKNSIELNPFNSSCFGILTDKNYVIKLKVIDINLQLFMLYCLAVLMFYYSQMLSQNKLFYYVSVFVFGMSASVLLLVYFTLKFLPITKSISMGVLAGWATVLGILLQAAFKNIFLILVNYKLYSLGYVFFSGLLSLVLYYRFGPIQDYRTKKLIKYGLQLVGALILWNGTHLVEAFEVTLVALIIFTNFSPFRPIGRVVIPVWNIVTQYLRNKYLVKPRKLLTQLEYYREGVQETETALYNLRNYCNSEEFNADWRIILSLRQFERFNRFLDGDSHITLQEENEYHAALLQNENDSLMSEDSDNSDD